MNRWDQKGIPHKGWECEGVIDLRGDDAAEDTAYAVCEMCGNERIRFVHRMAHPDGMSLGVGCVCAEKMTDDYEGPRRRETHLRNRATRRARWLRRKWRISKSGNPFLNIDGKNIGVHRSKFGGWGYHIDSTLSRASFATQSEAKLALFDALFPKV